MKQGFFEEHWSDENGNPAGGVSSGRGFSISWQNGPLGRGEERKEPNGAFVEDVLSAIVGRIMFYQESKFACPENAEALFHLGVALGSMNKRTADREKRNVEGIHVK